MQIPGTMVEGGPWPHIDVPADLPHGDMPGDQVAITDAHVAKANVVFPALAEALVPVLQGSLHGRAVVAVAGGSGVGKSEVASILAHGLRTIGLGAYTLSGDNYPRRIPVHNDAERLRIYRGSGIRGLIARGGHTADRTEVLRALQRAGVDADPGQVAEHPWLADYQAAGRAGLQGYLGTRAEIDFDELSGIVDRFASGAGSVHLRRLGRTEADLWYDLVDLSAVHVLVIEWTHGLSDHLHGVDVPILLHSTPAETAEHRRSRGRDKGTDSPFTTVVLQVEQELLHSQAGKAAIIVSRAGELLSHEQYLAAMRGDDD